MAFPAFVLAVALLLYVGVFAAAGRARHRYDVKAPAVTGPPEFERAFRVQQNTLEQLVVFVPGFWLFSIFVSPAWGPAIGFLWLLARIFYAWSYYRDPASRGPGFVVSMVSNLVLLIGSIGGMLRAF